MRIIFAGTPDFAVATLQMLIDSEHDVVAVYTQPDRPVGRGRKLQATAVKAVAQAAGIEVLQPASLQRDADVAQLKAFNADLMVVVAYGMILPQAVLDIPKRGCINVHASLLPRWRGAAPIQRAIMAGDHASGVTIMKMALKLDAGDMLHKEICDIGDDETASHLHDKLAQLGAKGLAQVLTRYEQGEVHGDVQDEELVTYAHKLEKSEAQLDWKQSAEILARQVRGLNAWPVAQTLYQGKVLRIWQAEPVSDMQLAPGLVHISAQKQLLVGTAEGCLNLLEVQLPGGKRMPCRAFLNAHKIDGIYLGE